MRARKEERWGKTSQPCVSRREKGRWLESAANQRGRCSYENGEAVREVPRQSPGEAASRAKRSEPVDRPGEQKRCSGRREGGAGGGARPPSVSRTFSPLGKSAIRSPSEGVSIAQTEVPHKIKFLELG